VEGVLGQYRIVKKLGEGGMGAVYLAEHTLLGRRAAVKVLQPNLSSNQDIVQRFFNEARAATAIADPGIVQIFDFGYHTDGSAYIVMEFLEGEPLDARLKRHGRLAPDEALRHVAPGASSLHAAHAAASSTATSSPRTSSWSPTARSPAASAPRSSTSASPSCRTTPTAR
jgi:serine/threonine protein kinase